MSDPGTHRGPVQPDTRHRETGVATRRIGETQQQVLGPDVDMAELPSLFRARTTTWSRLGQELHQHEHKDRIRERVEPRAG